MAFTSISDTAIQVGRAITRNVMSLIKTNLDDLDSRVTVTEGLANKVVIFNETIHNAASFSTATGLLSFRVQAAFNLTDAKIELSEEKKAVVRTSAIKFSIVARGDIAFPGSAELARHRSCRACGSR